jgi:hypothetical protein
MSKREYLAWKEQKAKAEVNEIIKLEFVSDECLEVWHQYCDRQWFGKGLEITCICHCHGPRLIA